MKALTIYAGPKALARIGAHGLRAQDIGIIPAAAGGPKGLIFQALDQWLFGSWLPSAPRERTLIGASIGAWRMAAACQADPVAAFARLGQLYVEQRHTSKKPSPQQIQQVVRPIVEELVRGHEQEILSHPHNRLHVLAVRGKAALAAPSSRNAELRGFASAALHNLASRQHLARLMERVIVADPRSQANWLQQPFDAFTTHHAALSASNLAPSMLASGTLPLWMPAVTGIAQLPHGHYWDGGMIDYHLALPYTRAAEGDLVLYPHFSQHVIPGWLDKALPWRRAARSPQRRWLDNLIIVAPSPEFLSTLPRAKLPDRSCFGFYGLDHDARVSAWRQAIGEGGRLRDELAQFVERPDVARILPL